MRIIGIDPGTRNVGYGVIEVNGNQITPVVYGTISVNEKEKIEIRLSIIQTKISQIIKDFLPTEGAI